MFFTADAVQITTAQITAPEAEVTVRAQDGLIEARVEINGPQEVVDGATAELRDGVWTIRLPEVATGPQTSTFTTGGGRGGRVTNFVANVGEGGRIIQAGNISGANIVGGSLGDVVFDSVQVGGTVYSGGQVQQQRVEVMLVIPTEIDLTARVAAGRIDTFDADLGVVDLHTGSGDVEIGRAIDVYVHSAAGTVNVCEVVGAAAITTRTGRIDVEGGTHLTLETSTGAIRWSATREATITARSRKGNITVRSEGHRITSDLKSRTGRVREA